MLVDFWHGSTLQQRVLHLVFENAVRRSPEHPPPLYRTSEYEPREARRLHLSSERSLLFAQMLLIVLINYSIICKFSNLSFYSDKEFSGSPACI